MPEIRYADLHVARPARIQSNGVQYGPPLGENWQQATPLPWDSMPAGTGEYAVIVSGKIGDVLLAGSTPQRGMMQVCLGTTGGLRFPHMRIAQTITDQIPTQEGVPFQFLLIVSATSPDPVLGASFTPSSVNELCLYARTYLNGDSQTYYCEFTLADVSWLWFDLARIPAGHWVAQTQDTPTTLPTTAPTAFEELSPAAIGAADETWLHFWNVWYEPRTRFSPAPVFAFGVTPDGTWPARETLVGTMGRWGQNRMPANGTLSEMPQVQQGAFAPWQHTNSTTRAGYAAWESAGAALRTEVKRYRHLAVRIDPLPDVRTFTEPGPVFGGVRLVDLWQFRFLTIERPAPSPGILTRPIVMVHQVARFLGQTSAYGGRVMEASGARGFTDEMFAQADAVRGEAVSTMTFGRRTFQTTSPAMQWRCHLIGSIGSANTAQLVHDFHFVAFHPVRDPANISDPPGSRPAAIVISPGRQSLDPASLPVPPSLPNGDPLEIGTEERPQIRGRTGYRRSWPVGSQPLKRFSISWGPLDEAATAALFAFLRTNAVWRYSSPRGVDLAVLNTSRPLIDPTSHRTAIVRVDVATLRWTGGA